MENYRYYLDGFDPDTDTRPLSVTGGLPYAGGPASNYLTHAVATMAPTRMAGQST